MDSFSEASEDLNVDLISEASEDLHAYFSHLSFDIFFSHVTVCIYGLLFLAFHFRFLILKGN